MKIEQTSYIPECNRAMITLYENDNDFVFELCESGNLSNTTLNDFKLVELKEIKAFIEKAIRYRETQE